MDDHPNLVRRILNRRWFQYPRSPLFKRLSRLSNLLIPNIAQKRPIRRERQVFRSHVAQRPKNKKPLAQMRMRDTKARLVYYILAVKQQIDVKRPRAPSLKTLATMSSFNIEANIEELARGRRCPYAACGIHVITLLWRSAYRSGPVKRRVRGRDNYRQALQLFPGSKNTVTHIADIASKSQVSIDLQCAHPQTAIKTGRRPTTPEEIVDGECAPQQAAMAKNTPIKLYYCYLYHAIAFVFSKA
jgi:hypothetical protein